ncbi:MAG TPA: hypothetical protein VMJ64_10535 [Anaerolineales bacterium]|nr:hypothetical protein [Anaerolineales bacterium]
MTKYTNASRMRGGTSQKKQVDPIWRGIGCLLILIVPLISYFGSVMLVQAAVEQNWPLPYQLVGYPVIPRSWWVLPGLIPVFTFIQTQANLWAILLFTVLLIVAIGAFVSLLYAIAWKFTGPPALGPYDVAPIRTTAKKYKR